MMERKFSTAIISNKNPQADSDSPFGFGAVAKTLINLGQPTNAR